ncbi:MULTISPECIES: thymidine kinase [Trueperella]|uniref:Thymidine kinase n=1 Tax=Trueperella bernardiae TaxID=59561 RepID=A0A0W1KK13_9ACTO|nr:MULTISPECIES: thymidine kinase [Trueperella]KTF03902.1 Thymidine kinase [Trueperella bernardiae]MCM3907789.1 thymidine kinase [Trueperella bernardiae]MDK8602040.1 thymidine kinase [Trueperella bernardiae]MDV6239624.1 thymidine kinase [Trueperella bernardiae]OCW60105.1 thymidine kinase [Trueperella bernardiae]
MAKLYFRYGTMNSGKTAGLLMAAHNFEESHQQILILKPALDSKAGAALYTRMGIERLVDHLVAEDDDLFELASNWLASIEGKTVGGILVDEAQFLTTAQVDQLLMAALTLNIPVLCYGLRTDFLTKVFPGSARLLETAHTLEELKTMCGAGCRRKANFNARKVNGQFVLHGEQIEIDNRSEVEYMALCGQCFLKLVGPIDGHRE